MLMHACSAASADMNWVSPWVILTVRRLCFAQVQTCPKKIGLISSGLPHSVVLQESAPPEGRALTIVFGALHGQKIIWLQK